MRGGQRGNSKNREANFKAITVAQKIEDGWGVTTTVEMNMKGRSQRDWEHILEGEQTELPGR